MNCVVHPNAAIGVNCTIFQHVTLNSKCSGRMNRGGAPTVGNYVMIGVGAYAKNTKVIGLTGVKNSKLE